tara:strand:- start:821 stop:1675 length:855 start_codon:yes stop_codon:yes gene_type:complete
MSTSDKLIQCIINLGEIHNFTIDIPENIDNLRNFHNWIKSKLIFNAQKQTKGIKLFDIAVGKGGDIMKWYKSGIKYVTGIDSDYHSIFENKEFDGAIKRYKNIKKNIPRLPKYYFLNLSATDSNTLNLVNERDRNTYYDIVSCQFAFHYFVKDIDIVLNLISNKLRKGGYFIGTASDGDIINKNLIKGDINLPILNIIKETKDSYIYFLNTNQSQRQTYFEQMGALSEYYLYKQNFINKCEEYNLKLLEIKNFSEWYNIYENKNLSSQEKIVSFMNFSFMFVKI